MASKLQIIHNGHAWCHYRKGKLHRVDGPAVIYTHDWTGAPATGGEYWWYKGKHFETLLDFLGIPELTDKQRTYIKLMWKE